MGAFTKISVLGLLLALANESAARIFLVDDGVLEAGAHRYKRQLPQGPQPDYVFAQDNDPLQPGELYQDSLPRPSRQSESRSPVRLQNFQRWDLGYDASDIINPPELKVAESQHQQYRTLNYRQPSAFDSPVIWGTPKKGAVVSRPGRSGGTIGVTTVYYRPRESKKRQVQGESDESEEDEDEEESEEEEEGYSPPSPPRTGYTTQGEGGQHSFHQVPSSIYDFIKLDEDGNIKFGRNQDMDMLASSWHPNRQNIPLRIKNIQNNPSSNVRRDPYAQNFRNTTPSDNFRRHFHQGSTFGEVLGPAKGDRVKRNPFHSSGIAHQTFLEGNTRKHNYQQQSSLLGDVRDLHALGTANGDSVRRNPFHSSGIVHQPSPFGDQPRRHDNHQLGDEGDSVSQGTTNGDRVRREHHHGVTGPVYTFVKTDKHGHFKWGVKHNVGHEYGG